MPTVIDTARALVQAAENQIQELIESAVSQRRYADVVVLAPIAEGLLALIRTQSGTGEIEFTNRSATRPQPKSRTDDLGQGVGRLPSETHSYPRFERQNDRLVKIAWSKKDRREYEHRAPADTIFTIARQFERDAKPGAPFLMDQVMPFKNGDGAEIPSYQAYLALAWFRLLGLVETRGKDGYAVGVENLYSHVERAWSDMPDTLRR